MICSDRLLISTSTRIEPEPKAMRGPRALARAVTPRAGYGGLCALMRARTVDSWMAVVIPAHKRTNRTMKGDSYRQSSPLGLKDIQYPGGRRCTQAVLIIDRLSTELNSAWRRPCAQLSYKYGGYDGPEHSSHNTIPAV